MMAGTATGPVGKRIGAEIFQSLSHRLKLAGMNDLFEDEPKSPGDNTPEFTVSELAGTVRRILEGELSWVRIRGEVGRVVDARSGHLYFDLKDEKSVLQCMTWRGQRPGLSIMPEEGMEVVAEGKMTASGMQSKFGLNVQRL